MSQRFEISLLIFDWWLFSLEWPLINWLRCEKVILSFSPQHLLFPTSENTSWMNDSFSAHVNLLFIFPLSCSSFLEMLLFYLKLGEHSHLNHSFQLLPVLPADPPTHFPRSPYEFNPGPQGPPSALSSSRKDFKQLVYFQILQNTDIILLFSDNSVWPFFSKVCWFYSLNSFL